MREPQARDTPIDARRYGQWLADYSAYRYQVTEMRITSWLDQFPNGDRVTAARLLDAVDFVGHERISTLYRKCLAAIPGWNINERLRKGKWRFVAFSGSAGESGDSMLHEFRLANGLDRKKYNDLFILRRDLIQENLGSEDTVIFVDDFSGSGKQICDAWPEFQELLVGGPVSYIVLVAAGNDAVKAIKERTDLLPIPGFKLGDKDKFFHSDCRHFTPAEKNAMLAYCTVIQPGNPRGVGECGYTVVFSHRCPNNSVPILWCHKPNWWAVFPRSNV